jgi:hypothetical protein
MLGKTNHFGDGKKRSTFGKIMVKKGVKNGQSLVNFRKKLNHF